MRKLDHIGMRLLDGGTFLMGSRRFYLEETPVRRVGVAPFWIDEVPVTNDAFAYFVAETGYVTLAEQVPKISDYPGISAEMMQAGSLVFEKPCGPVDLSDVTQWWRFCFGADWRHPTGPGSDLEGMWDHPVCHIAFCDAEAFARWAGKALPTEAEWEFAARGGLDGMDYAWGNELAPGGAMLANYWQGHFPFANQMLDGWERTSPVRSFPANGYELFDMIGNVWEWTCDPYTASPHAKRSSKKCCTRSRSPAGLSQTDMPARVLKGGSHLCAANYCQRYRPAARHPQPVDTSTSHVGFRCVSRI